MSTPRGTGEISKHNEERKNGGERKEEESTVTANSFGRKGKEETRFDLLVTSRNGDKTSGKRNPITGCKDGTSN